MPLEVSSVIHPGQTAPFSELLHGKSLVMITSIIVLSFLLLYLFQPALQRSSQRPTPAPITVGPPDDRPVYLSVVIPAYDEEERLTIMLKEAVEYMRTSDCKFRRPNTTTEWILVNDGSTDLTSHVYRDFARQNPGFLYKLIELPVNCGKGAAVRAGMLHATGGYCLMVDADGATEFGYGLQQFAQYPDCVLFGSRSRNIEKNRSALRRILKSCFRLFVGWLVNSWEIQDTQCGFKIFPQSSLLIFESLHLQRWAFDIEILYLLQALRIPTKEVPVHWHEVDGSKLNRNLWTLVLASIGMLRDMLCIRLCYTLGMWRVKEKRG